MVHNNRRSVFMSSSSSSSSSEMDQPPSKILKLELDDPIKVKLSQYLDQFTTSVRSGEFVVQTKLRDVPPIGLRVIETGKLIKFPLQEDEVMMEELAASQFEIMNNEDWSTFEENLLDDIQTEFGFVDTDNISVSLQKVFFQKPGSKFPINLDHLFTTTGSDKVDNNNGEESLKRSAPFGHLVIQLPSHYTGGNFHFRHDGKEKEFDMSASMTKREGWSAQYSLAYYAHLDQNHVSILSGVRSCLIYNLEIELDHSKSALLPRAPTLKNIVPSFFQIIQEWKGSDKMGKVLPLPCTNEEINPSVISTILGPTLRDNGVTLFHGRKESSPGNSATDDSIEFISSLRILASVDVQVEEAFANFLQNESNDNGNDDGDDVGLEFDLKQDKISKCVSPRGVSMFLFFLSGDSDGDNDIFEHEDWFKSREFWRFRSHLFLTKSKNVGKNDPQLSHAANALVSLETVVEEYEEDLFPKTDHFENLLEKFLLLEDDTQPLEQLLKICQNKSNFLKLFPALAKSGMDWTILKFAWQDFFCMTEIENGSQFMEKVNNFSIHISNCSFLGDKNRQELYVDTFIEILEKFKVLQTEEKFDSIYEETQAVSEFFGIAEVLRYNLFAFMKSMSATFVKQVFCLSNVDSDELGVVWVRLVTDLYSCTNLLKYWPEEDDDLDEYTLLLSYFEVVERVGADIKGILGDAKKYGVLVKALSRHSNINDEDDWDSDNDEDVQQLSKFWVPFATRLEARIEALLPSEVDKRPQNGTDNNCDPPDPSEEMEMLKEIRKLLANVKTENDK